MKLGETLGYRVGDGDETKVRVVGMRLAHGYIHNTETGENCPGVELFLDPVDGGKRFWTKAFPDTKREWT